MKNRRPRHERGLDPGLRALATLAQTSLPPGLTATNRSQLSSYANSYPDLLATSNFHIGCIHGPTIMHQRGDALYCKLYGAILFANQTYIYLGQTAGQTARYTASITAAEVIT